MTVNFSGFYLSKATPQPTAIKNQQGLTAKLGDFNQPAVDTVLFSSGRDDDRLVALSRKLVSLMFNRAEELRRSNPAMNQLMSEIDARVDDIDAFKDFLSQVNDSDTVFGLEQDIASFQASRGSLEEIQGLTMVLAFGLMAYQQSQS